VPAGGRDLRAYYLGQRHYFWGLLVLFVAHAIFQAGLMSYPLLAE